MLFDELMKRGRDFLGVKYPIIAELDKAAKLVGESGGPGGGR
jgi:hypothetical protein